MISFTCPRCNLGYQYPDDMAGQKIRCTGPNCNQKLLIPAPTEQPTMVAPITASGPAERRWNYLENGQTKGPVAAAELKRLVAGGRLTPKDPVWTTGMGDWLPLHEALPELFRRPPVEVTPTPPETQDGRSILHRICLGSVKGIALSFLVVFLLILEIGLSALLDTRRSSGYRRRSSLLENFLPPDARLGALLVVLASVLSVAIGAFAGSAIARDHGGFIGAGAGYFLGSMSAGAFVEVMKGRRGKKS